MPQSGETFGENAVSGEEKPVRAATIKAKGTVKMLKLASGGYALSTLSTSHSQNPDHKSVKMLKLTSGDTSGECALLTLTISLILSW